MNYMSAAAASGLLVNIRHQRQETKHTTANTHVLPPERRRILLNGEYSVPDAGFSALEKNTLEHTYDL